MSDPVKITLVGATGLVGRAVMEELVGRPDFRLTAMGRREVPLPKGARMEMRLAPVEQWGEVLEEIQQQVVVCALGTTWHKAGRDEESFREVDYTLVLDVARAAKAAGAWHFIYISSVGASSASKNLYLRVKGETETALAKLHFKRLDILRPGLLRGVRRGDMRLLEGLGRLASPITDMVLQGGWRRYRSISAHRLSQAILSLAREKAGGRFVHEYDSLMRAIHRFELAEQRERG
ncbi:MAG TPA: NAD(P)H-binding protein [Sphingomonadaceae bacterium]|nr:NAD(P)H-binding protein [Sphingomonadaceae bacterium]